MIETFLTNIGHWIAVIGVVIMAWFYPPHQAQASFVPGPQRKTLAVGSGGNTPWTFAPAFTVVPVVVCTAEGTSTTQALSVTISSKSMTGVTVNVFQSQAPTLSGNLLNIVNINVGQPFAASTSTTAGTLVDCLAAAPTQ